MPKVTIDGKEYDTDKLPKEVTDSIMSLRITDGNILKLKQELAIAQTARNFYALTLKEQLEKNNKKKK